MLASDNKERKDTRREAAVLCNKLGKLETALMTIFWDTVLNRFKLTSNGLQKRDMDLMTAVRLLESLYTYVASLRGQFADFETSARAVLGVTQTYQSETNRVSKEEPLMMRQWTMKYFSREVKSSKLKRSIQLLTVCCQD